MGEIIKGRGDITHEILFLQITHQKALASFLGICECEEALANNAMLAERL